jgi:hypothetical protein
MLQSGKKVCTNSCDLCGEQLAFIDNLFDVVPFRISFDDQSSGHPQNVILRLRSLRLFDLQTGKPLM